MKRLIGYRLAAAMVLATAMATPALAKQSFDSASIQRLTSPVRMTLPSPAHSSPWQGIFFPKERFRVVG
jgi:hypothetical protein